MELCDLKKCTGCGACFNICPRQCISMQVSDNGFQYPIVDQSICSQCGLCSKNCPAIHPQIRNTPIAVFSATYKSDDHALRNSSSGGVAYALSKYVLDIGGVVFGAAYDTHMTVKHIEITDCRELYKLQGSKYVQSDTGDTFSKVKKYLTENKTVLFIGLPCQIAGLYSFLNHVSTENLITCDMLCGGVPSPGVFSRYISYLEKKYQCEIENLNFRSKKYGYGYLLLQLMSNGKSHLLYGNDAAFLKSLGAGYNRNSCFDCEYASLERVGDITIGDAWKLKAESNLLEKGISLVLINSLKGEKLFSNIKENLIYLERNIDDVTRSQHASIGRKKVKPSDYDNYYRDYKVMEWGNFAKKYLRPQSLKQRILDSVHPVITLKLSKIVRK